MGREKEGAGGSGDGRVASPQLGSLDPPVCCSTWLFLSLRLRAWSLIG